MKKILSALVMSTLLFGAGSAEAYQQWQGYCARQTTAYTNPELTRRNGVEYVGAGDNVTVHDEQGNAYYVEYPLTRGGTKTRWVPKSAISGAPSSSGSIFVAGVEKAAQAAVQATSYQPWSGYCARQTTAYTNPELTQRNGVEYVGAGDNVTILGEQGSAYYVEYPLTRGGTKKRWIPKSAISSSGRADTAPSMPSNTIIGEAPSRPATNTSYQSWSGYCARKTTAYTNPELTQRSGVEYVGAGDNVTVLGEQGSAYYVEYPLTRGGTKKRWVPKSAVSGAPTANIASGVITGAAAAVQQQQSASYQSWSGYCARKTTAYTNPELTQRSGVEYVGAGDNVTVLGEQGSAYYVEYPLTRGGTKKRWVPKSAISQQGGSSGNYSSITQGNAGDTAYWSGRIGQTIADINSSYYTSGNIYYTSGYKGQCTWYAFGRAKEVGALLNRNFNLKAYRHAKYWAENAIDCVVDANISSKSVGVRTTDDYGHVIFIEYVDDQNVYYTESNADKNNRYDPGVDAILKVKPRNDAFIKKFSFFIHLT